MWVRTQEGDLVNLDQMEWVVIERYEDEDEDEDEDEGEGEGYRDAGDDPDTGAGTDVPEGLGDFELRAYQFGWDPDDESGSSYYTLSSSPQRSVVEEHLAMIRAAISKGDKLVEMPAPAAGWTS